MADLYDEYESSQATEEDDQNESEGEQQPVEGDKEEGEVEPPSLMETIAAQFRQTNSVLLVSKGTRIGRLRSKKMDELLRDPEFNLQQELKDNDIPSEDHAFFKDVINHDDFNAALEYYYQDKEDQETLNNASFMKSLVGGVLSCTFDPVFWTLVARGLKWGSPMVKVAAEGSIINGFGYMIRNYVNAKEFDAEEFARETVAGGLCSLVMYGGVKGVVKGAKRLVDSKAFQEFKREMKENFTLGVNRWFTLNEKGELVQATESPDGLIVSKVKRAIWEMVNATPQLQLQNSGNPLLSRLGEYLFRDRVSTKSYNGITVEEKKNLYDVKKYEVSDKIFNIRKKWIDDGNGTKEEFDDAVFRAKSQENLEIFTNQNDPIAKAVGLRVDFETEILSEAQANRTISDNLGDQGITTKYNFALDRKMTALTNDEIRELAKLPSLRTIEKEFSAARFEDIETVKGAVQKKVNALNKESKKLTEQLRKKRTKDWEEFRKLNEKDIEKFVKNQLSLLAGHETDTKQSERTIAKFRQQKLDYLNRYNKSLDKLFAYDVETAREFVEEEEKILHNLQNDIIRIHERKTGNEERDVELFDKKLDAQIQELRVLKVKEWAKQRQSKIKQKIKDLKNYTEKELKKEAAEFASKNKQPLTRLARIRQAKRDITLFNREQKKRMAEIYKLLSADLSKNINEIDFIRELSSNDLKTGLKPAIEKILQGNIRKPRDIDTSMPAEFFGKEVPMSQREKVLKKYDEALTLLTGKYSGIKLSNITEQSHVFRKYNKEKIKENPAKFKDLLKKSVILNNPDLDDTVAGDIANLIMADITGHNPETWNPEFNERFKPDIDRSRIVAITDEVLHDNGFLEFDAAVFDENWDKLVVQTELNSVAQQFGFENWEALKKQQTDTAKVAIGKMLAERGEGKVAQLESIHNVQTELNSVAKKLGFDNWQALKDSQPNVAEATIEKMLAERGEDQATQLESIHNYNLQLLNDSESLLKGTFRNTDFLRNHRVINSILNWKGVQFACMAGKMALSCIPDAAMVILRTGLGRACKKLPGIRQLFFRESNLSKEDKAQLTQFLGFLDRAIQNNAMTDLGYAPYDKFSGRVAQMTSKWTGMDYIIKSYKQTTAEEVFHQIINDCVHEPQSAFLKKMGLNKRDIGIIKNEFLKNGSKYKDINYFDLNLMEDNYENLVVKDKLRASITSLVDQTILTPGAGDVPRFLRTGVGSALFMFHTYPFLVWNHLFMPLMRGDISKNRFAQAAFASLALSIFRKEVADFCDNKETDRTSAEYWKEVVDYSLLSNYFVDAAFTGARLFTSRNPVRDISPTIAWFDNTFRLVSDVINPYKTVNPSRILNMMPVTNYWYVRPFTSRIFDGGR